MAALGETIRVRPVVDAAFLDDRTNSYGLTERGHREIEARREWEDQYVAVEA